MAYVGNPVDTQNTFQSLVGKRFDGDGSTTDFTLDVAPSSTLDIEVFVGNVRQDPNSAYTLSGTTLSFTGAPPSGTNNIYVVHQAKSVGTIDVPDSSINSNKLTGNLVTPGTLDVNGQELILDADADTSITADTDDQIDVKIAGADDFKFTANNFNILSGSTLTVDSGATITNSGTANGFGGSTDVLFAATMTAHQTMSHEVTAKIAFNDEIYDVGTCYDHSSNYRFTVPSGKGGYYHIGYSLVIENAANSRQYINWIRPYKNGSDFHLGSGSYGGQVQYYQNNTDNPTRNIHATKSFIINLSASDYIEIYAQSATNNSSTSQAKGDYSMFWGYKLVT
jgi:hypothetical protein